MRLSRTLAPTSVTLPIDTSSSRLRTICRTMGRGDFVLRKPPKANGSRAVAGVVTGTLCRNGQMLFITRGVTTLSMIRGELVGVNLTPFYLRLRSGGTQGASMLDRLGRSARVFHCGRPRRFGRRSRELFGVHRRVGKCMRTLRQVCPYNVSICRTVAHCDSVSRARRVVVPTSLLTSLAGRRFGR